MTDQTPENPQDQEVIYGPTRAMVTLNEFNPPVIIMLDIHGNAMATPGVSKTLFENIREALASALGPYPLTPAEPEPERPGKGKGKKEKGGKGKGKKDKPEREPEPETPDSPDEAEDTDPADLPNPEDIPSLDVNADPEPGDVDLREPRVVVNAAVEIDPAAFADWYTSNHPWEDVPDPALNPSLVADYLDDIK